MDSSALFAFSIRVALWGLLTRKVVKMKKKSRSGDAFLLVSMFMMVLFSYLL